MYAEFNAQTAMGDKPAKGYLYQENFGPNDVGWFVVDVDTVYVAATSAWFGRVTVDGGGAYADEAAANKYRWTKVWDGGDGTSEVGDDFFRGSWQLAAPTWADAGGNDSFSGGNVQIHYWAE